MQTIIETVLTKSILPMINPSCCKAETDSSTKVLSFTVGFGALGSDFASLPGVFNIDSMSNSLPASSPPPKSS